MLRTSLILIVSLIATLARGADEEIFSGPQVGEKLAAFKARGVLGDLAGKEVDLVGDAKGQPTAIIFVHEVTRPSVGLTRLIMNYAGKRATDGLHGGVVFLTDDPTDTENWMKRASRALPKDVFVGISLDGKEGPGAYGLNRNVTLTVLVGKDDKVTANYALVQPSIQADAPKIAKSMVDVLGGGKVPTLAQLGARGYNDTGRPKNDPKLAPLLRALIQKTATAEEVEKAAKAIEEYIADKKAAQQDVGTRAKRIVDGRKLENYGTPAAQAYLKKWAEKYGKAAATPKRKRQSRDSS